MWITPVLLIIWLSSAAASSPVSSSLSQVTDHLSVIARLVNGIALQNGFSTNMTHFNDFIAELLDLESGDTVQKLLGVAVDSSIGANLDTILTEVKGLSESPMGDSSKVKDGILKLETMKTKVDSLKAGEVGGLEEPLKSQLEQLAQFGAFEEDLLKTQNLEQASEWLDLMAAPFMGGVTESSALLNALTKYDQHGTTIVREFKAHLEYANKLTALLAIIDKYKALEPVNNIVEVAEEYKAQETVITQLPSSMGLLKQDSNVLLPIVQRFATFSLTSLSLSSVLPDLKAFEVPRTSKALMTAGFPNGAKDIGKIFKDLQSGWLKDNVADGKDMKRIAEQLVIVKKMSGKLEELDTAWDPFRKVSNIGNDAENMATTLKSLAEEGEKLSTVTSLGTSIDFVADSVKDLKAFAAPPDVEKFKQVYNFVKKLSDQVSALKAAYEEVVPKVTKAQTDAMGSIVNSARKIARITNPKAEDIAGVVGEIQQTVGFAEAQKNLHNLITKIKPLASDILSLIKETPDWTVVKPAQSLLKTTGLVAALDKLKTNSYDPSGIDQLLGFGINARKVQATQKAISDVKNVLTAVSKAKDVIANVKNEVQASIGGSRRRRRKAPAPSALRNFTNSQTVASSFGRGVNLLRNLVNAHQKRTQLTAAADSSDDVNSAITSVPTFQQVWTSTNRKGLKKMVDQLEELEKYAAANKDKDLLEMGSVLQKAGDIQGVQIDSKLLKKDVLPVLEASTNQQVRGAAPVFKDLSDLELDFAKHSTDLKGALVNLDGIRKFFDDFFGITRTSEGAAEAQELDDTENKVLILALIGLGGAVGVGGAAAISIFFCLKWRRAIKYRKMLKDPERWNLLLFHHENVCTQVGKHDTRVHKFIANDDFAAFKTAIKNAYYVDARTQDTKEAKTLLHDCVQHDKPKFAKYLIEHGADLWLQNHLYETPMQMAKRLKRKKIVALLKKYEKKKVYPKVVPELLARNMHKVDIDVDIEDGQYKKSKFLKKFMTNRSVDSFSTTHYVVKTDKEDLLHVKEHHLKWIFSPTMLMNHKWMEACLDDPEALVHNKKWRVKGFKYEGVMYDSLARIKDNINRRKVPYLFGAYVCFMEPSEWRSLRHAAFTYLYATETQTPVRADPEKNLGHIYYLDDVPLQILIYRTVRGKEQSANYAPYQDYYWVVSVEEFIHFLLEFEINCKKVAVTKGWVDPRIKYQKEKNHKKKKEESTVTQSGGESVMSKTKTVSKTTTPTKTVTKSVTNSTPTK